MLTQSNYLLNRFVMCFAKMPWHIWNHWYLSFLRANDLHYHLGYLNVFLIQYRLSSVNHCGDGLGFEVRTIWLSKSHWKNENFMTCISNGHIRIIARLNVWIKNSLLNRKLWLRNGREIIFRPYAFILKINILNIWGISQEMGLGWLYKIPHPNNVMHLLLLERMWGQYYYFLK